MSDRVLLRVQGSMLLSNTWKQELVITEHDVRGEVLQAFKRIKMSLPYDRIAQVNIVRGILSAELEVVNKGGTDNLIVRGLSKRDAERAKDLIEERMRAGSPGATGSVADELAKLADLKDRAIITQAEFDEQKRRLLAKG